MENATKALIIAGAVLIAIVLIAVGIKILGSTKGAIDQTDNVSKTMAKSIFNSQFQQYEGNQNGSAVRSLFSKVVTNNGTNKIERFVFFTYKERISGNSVRLKPDSRRKSPVFWIYGFSRFN